MKIKCIFIVVLLFTMSIFLAVYVAEVRIVLSYDERHSFSRLITFFQMCCEKVNCSQSYTFLNGQTKVMEGITIEHPTTVYCQATSILN